ncbi:hypothetical protein BCAR13_110082 [Paraburkholderia caribensis]|uniref:hypothetical protein n=1 Tax=Paraburkholderia caribensis TaxID=75105 RepID=UPI001CB5DC2A|nr:hypothetical protein [Paraburkholderia caribensis]CAG9193997.1 hypothetical protein BCAR13_110082 [Paraburkholderia caribensis]
MNDQLIKLARDAGLTVVLDGTIGTQHYHSVTGSIDALERFADACMKSPPSPARRTSPGAVMLLIASQARVRELEEELTRYRDAKI